jgi:quercetin dioxygenase-like cupin family protein
MTDAEQHFTARTDGTPTASGRYVDVASIKAAEFLPGLGFRPVLGERTMLNFVSFEPNTEAPMHVHEEEQIVLVLEGEFEIDGDVRLMHVGEFAVVPSWVPHGARTSPAARSMSSTLQDAPPWTTRGVRRPPDTRSSGSRGRYRQEQDRPLSGLTVS